MNSGLSSVRFITRPYIFNGDDSIVVRLGAQQTDVFGNPGSDPGSAWSGNGVSTANQNIELNTGISTGSTGFTDPSLRFNTVSTAPTTATGLAGFGIAPVMASGNQAPVITDLLQSPPDITVTSMQDVTIAADVTDDAGLSSVKILYDVSTNGMFSGTYGQEVTMTASGSDYTGDIPAQANGSTVFYVVEAIDNDMTAMLTSTTMQFSYTVNNPVTSSFVAVQDFDGTLPVWTATINEGDANASYGLTGSGTRLSNGERVELVAFNTSNLQDLAFLMDNASVGGIENADALEIYIAVNGASFSSTPDIKIQ